MDTIEVIITAVVTGGTSSVATIAALRVHIQYLRETVTRLESAIQRAHERIDEMQRQS